MATILCVDDDPAALAMLQTVLEGAHHRVVAVHNVAAAFNVLARGGIDLILSDYMMPDTTGLEFLAGLARHRRNVPLIMITGYASIEHAVASLKAGAIDYLTKPFGPQQVEIAVQQALEFTRLQRENAALREEVTRLRDERTLVGASAALERVMQTVAMVAPTRATILLQGQSGTGKELIARTIHQRSDRRDGPFVSVNCPAIPVNLVESTLFGHEKGAFTGALRQVKGAFERAHGGTLLLDEVSETQPELQAKLLRVLQEQEFERVGGTTPIRVDVRVIATTNRDLLAEVQKGRFREDLYYRLSVVPIRVPTLRERLEDIPLLVQAFVARAARETGRTITAIAPETFTLLQTRDWPGNIRELAHAVERAVILSAGPVLTPEAFDRSAAPQDLDAPSSPVPVAEPPAGDLSRTVVLSSLDLAAAQDTIIRRALQITNQNRTHAARLLGISVRTLRARINRPDAS